MYISLKIHWALIALLQLETNCPTAGFLDPIRAATIHVETIAVPLLPQAQQDGVCTIITVKGLGFLDGDYSMLENLFSGEKTSWIGTSPDTQDLLMSWNPLAHLWTIGNRLTGLYHAYVPAEGGNIPPGSSSQWRMFDSGLSDFREVPGRVTVYCPACTVATVSDLVHDDLSVCNGPYHLAENIGEGISAWFHIAEKCMYILGSERAAITTSESFIAECIGGTGAGARGRRDLGVRTQQPLGCLRRFSAEIDKITRSTTQVHGMSQVHGMRTAITCTSAGSTTRLVFGLTTAGPTRHDTNDTHMDEAHAPEGVEIYEFVLTSAQQGTVISSAQGHVHVSVSVGEPLVLAGSGDSKDMRHHRPLYLHDEPRLSVYMSVNGDELVTGVPLRIAREKGILISLHGFEGTHAIQLCLSDDEGTWQRSTPIWKGLEGRLCLAVIMLTLEAFPPESHVIQGRSMRAPAALTSPSAAKPAVQVQREENGPDQSSRVRVAFVLDLEVVDGYKLSSLHLMKHLPKTIEASALDLSCSSGPAPMMHVFEDETIPVTRLCITMPRKDWVAMDHQVGGAWFQLYSALESASSWGDVTDDHPSVSRALAPLHEYLDAVDAMIMSNGAKDKDAYLLHLARLSGVKARVVNLGAITGGYVSPLFDGATALVAPSHFVASNPAVSRHAAGLHVQVCYPVMDASRILAAATSCPSTESQASAASGPGVSNPSSRETVGGRVHTSAIFTMVSRLSTCKTPGIFVRAMSVLRRRGISEARGKLIGTGPLLEPMEELAKHLDAKVRFSGFVPMDDVPCEVMRATALVLPSFSLETFGMVAPEAMILGIPVITFGFGGTGELVRHMENGLVVDDPTPRGLADAMELLVRDRKLRDRLGTQARLDASRAMFLPDMVQCHLDALASPARGEEKQALVDEMRRNETK